MATKLQVIFCSPIFCIVSHKLQYVGKVVSVGAIVLYCLNLPIEIRFLLENVFILGLIPPAGSPDVWTISHILPFLTESFNKFAEPGQVLETHDNPQGVSVLARLLALIADLGAVRKVAGYVSHSADCFCSFCHIRKDQIDNLKWNQWSYRDGPTVHAQALAWKALPTLQDQKTASKKNGVRWTPIHDVYKWDPVRHVVLGYMHNWLEGVLQHHLRILWGIGRTKKAVKDLKEAEEDEEFSESDASETSQELDDIKQTGNPLEDEDDWMDVDEDASEREASATPTASTYTGMLFDDDDSDDDEDAEFQPTDLTSVFNFNADELEMIRSCIRDVDLPTWVGRPPSNLGEAKHGKVKAQELLVLFTVIFPLIMPEIWWREGETGDRLLNNFHDVVACTNILASYSTSNSEAERYMDHYVQYRTSKAQLFPEFNSVPNHHLAMHNGDQLKFWGPLALLSEFPGERMNGGLGKIKTNRHLGKIQ